MAARAGGFPPGICSEKHRGGPADKGRFFVSAEPPAGGAGKPKAKRNMAPFCCTEVYTLPAAGLCPQGKANVR